MKKKSMFSRVASLILGTALLTTSLSGCSLGGKEESLVDKASQNTKEFVFRSETLDFLEAADYSNLAIVGDKVYAATYSKGGYITISSFNPDGSDLKSIKIPESDQESHGNLTYDSEGNLYCLLYKYDFSYEDEDEVITYSEEDEKDGNAGAEASAEDASAENASVEDTSTENISAKEATSEEASATEESSAVEESTAAEASSEDEGEGMGYVEEEGEGEYQYLVKYDPEGNELFRIDLQKDMQQGEYYSMYNMVYDDANGLIISSNMGIDKLNEGDGTFTKIVDTRDKNNEYYDISISLYKGFGGQIFASLWSGHGMELRTFDPTTGKFGEKSELFAAYEDCSFFGGNGYDLYVSKNDGFYGYDAVRDNLVKLLDYVDSELSVSYSLSTVVAINDTEFIANVPDEDYNYSLCRLTKIPADEVRDKTVITLAGNSIDYSVRQVIYKFNQESDEYKVKLVDYSPLNTDEDWNAGANQFNLDIVSGNVPDIMFFFNEEPVDSYINKGLFLDIAPFIKNDPELADVEFVQNVFDAFKTEDKLFQLVPTFYVNTVSAKSSVVKGKETLTLKECKELIEAKGINYGNSFGLSDRQTILYNGILASGDRFIDWENKKCNFDSEEFIELLEFAKQFPAEISEDAWMDYDEACYRNETALFEITYLNGFRPYKRYAAGAFGTDITFIGFPNEMGVNCSVIHPSIRLAISSQTKHADVCWQILRQFLLEDYQDKVSYDFPIRKSSFDKLAEASKEKESWIDDDGKKHYEDDYYWIGDTQITIPPMNQKDVDYVKNFIESLSMVYQPNTNVFNIINEEASAFFSGQKSAKEVADIMQSRLSIYVNENS